MAKVSDMTGRTDGAYTRLFGDEKRGYLLSQVHGAVIRSGNELEKYIGTMIAPANLNTLQRIIKGDFRNQSTEIVLNPGKPKVGEKDGIVSDFGVFFHRQSRFNIIELKAGDTFDTQKSPAIKKNLQAVVEHISHATHYAGSFYVCSFNAGTKEAIVSGFKRAFTLGQVLTGHELCLMLGVDYEDVRTWVEAHQTENRDYFDTMAEKARNGNDVQDFVDAGEEIRTGQRRLKW